MDRPYITMMAELIKMQANLDIMAEANADGERACGKLLNSVKDLKAYFTQFEASQGKAEKN